jgi:ankyrin repeat protein
MAAVQILLQRGADIEAKDDEGNTASMRAAQAGQTEVLGLLKAQEAKHALNIELIKAAAMGDIKLVKNLLANGADVNATIMHMNGLTALLAATRQGHTDTVRVLLTKGAAVNASDTDAATALITDGVSL